MSFTKITFSFISLFILSLSFAQKEGSYNKWSISYGVGSHLWTKPMGYTPDNQYLQNFQVSHHELNGRYMFNNRFGIMLNLGYDFFDYQGLGKQNTNYIGTSIQGVVNVGDILKLGNLNERLGLLLHGGIGHGVMWQKYPEKSDKDNTILFAAGVTPQVKLTEKWSVKADATLNMNHKQDVTYDFQSKLSRKNSLNYTGLFFNVSLGVTYHIGGRTKHADWTPTEFGGGNVYDDTELKRRLDEAESKVKALEERTKDDDNDGVFNYHDKEPNTPPNVKVDSDGIEIIEVVYGDKDGDGIKDNVDVCPDLAGIPQNYGCPEIKKEDQQIMQQAVEGVKFETGKDVLTKESLYILNYVAENMKLNPHYKLKIEGYTDNVGEDAANLDLSTRRARTVKNYLISKNIDGNRMQDKGFGEANPIADNDTPEGRAKNRRVDFIIVFKFD